MFFVTNQAGLAEGLITMDEFNQIHNKVLQLIAPTGITITDTYLCPHGENDNCTCRKPKPKLLFDAAREHDIDLVHSWMIGGRPSDVVTGVNAVPIRSSLERAYPLLKAAKQPPRSLRYLRQYNTLPAALKSCKKAQA